MEENMQKNLEEFLTLKKYSESLIDAKADKLITEEWKLFNKAKEFAAGIKGYGFPVAITFPIIGADGVAEDFVLKISYYEKDDKLLLGEWKKDITLKNHIYYSFNPDFRDADMKDMGRDYYLPLLPFVSIQVLNKDIDWLMKEFNHQFNLDVERKSNLDKELVSILEKKF
jgi:hypothetical protein